MYNVPMTPAMISSLRTSIEVHKDALASIERQIEKIQRSMFDMSDAELLAAKSELVELRNELFQHRLFLEKSKKTLGSFYQPAIR